jgi:hypothetical protein
VGVSEFEQSPKVYATRGPSAAARAPLLNSQLHAVVEFCRVGNVMTRVEVIEHEIKKLSPDEFAQLRDWFLEKDWEEWDRQIEADSAAGKLDQLFEDALKDHREGKSTKF